MSEERVVSGSESLGVGGYDTIKNGSGSEEGEEEEAQPCAGPYPALYWRWVNAGCVCGGIFMHSLLLDKWKSKADMPVALISISSIRKQRIIQ